MDLNAYRTPDLTVMDSSIGMPDVHLGGHHCDPPVNKLLGGFDARAVDREAATLLGLDWKMIQHCSEPPLAVVNRCASQTPLGLPACAVLVCQCLHLCAGAL